MACLVPVGQTDEARHHLMPAYGRGHDKHVTDVAVMSDEKQEGQGGMISM